jgi:hypothetical protein
MKYTMAPTKNPMNQAPRNSVSQNAGTADMMCTECRRTLCGLAAIYGKDRARDIRGMLGEQEIND